MLIISVDGLRPDLLARAYTPNLHGLMRGGEFHAVGADDGGGGDVAVARVDVDGGDAQAARDRLEPGFAAGQAGVSEGEHVVRPGDTRGGYSTALVAGKSKFEVFAETRIAGLGVGLAPRDRPTTGPSGKPATQPADSVVPAEEWPDDSAKAKKENLSDAVVAEHAAELIREHRPDVTVVHFPHVDNVGHVVGWGTPEQVVAVEEADAAVGVVLRPCGSATWTSRR